MDSEVRQKFEAYYGLPVEKLMNSFAAWQEAYRLGMRAGEIAMREKAARFAETHWTVRVSHAMPEVPANFGVREEFVPQTSLIPLAAAIRALAISGAEEYYASGTSLKS